ncbi:MAG: hypothetical protein Q4F57_03305 [Weeksellaceae bacterium]|nr:hypothetical protein [Weeksellaceae bacterium]
MRAFITGIFLLSGLFMQGQILGGWGVKAGLTYNADAGVLSTANNVYSNSGSGNAGFHVGVFKPFSLGGFYVQPELWYVNTSSSYNTMEQRSVNINQQRIDVPVSLGMSVLNIARIQAGPLLSYYFQDNASLSDVTTVRQQDIALGMQVGASVQLAQFQGYARYDFGLGQRTTDFVQDNNVNFQTNNTPQMLHIGIGYVF